MNTTSKENAELLTSWGFNQSSSGNWWHVLIRGMSFDFSNLPPEELAMFLYASGVRNGMNQKLEEIENVFTDQHDLPEVN